VRRDHKTLSQTFFPDGTLWPRRYAAPSRTEDIQVTLRGGSHSEFPAACPITGGAMESIGCWALSDPVVEVQRGRELGACVTTSNISIREPVSYDLAVHTIASCRTCELLPCGQQGGSS
jgi:hypothetical protein